MKTDRGWPRRCQHQPPPRRSEKREKLSITKSKDRTVHGKTHRCSGEQNQKATWSIPCCRLMHVPHTGCNVRFGVKSGHPAGRIDVDQRAIVFNFEHVDLLACSILNSARPLTWINASLQCAVILSMVARSYRADPCCRQSKRVGVKTPWELSAG